MEHEKQRDNFDVSYFNQLPKELKELILLNLNLNIVDVLKIQSTSKEWRELTWRCLTDLNTNLITDTAVNYISGLEQRLAVAKIISRLNFTVLRKLITDEKDTSMFTEDMILGCQSLEYLELGFQSLKVLEYADNLKNLSEISFNDITKPSDINTAELKCRANMNVYNDRGANNKDTPISPKLNYTMMNSHSRSLYTSGKWEQKGPIKLNKKFQQGGMIGDDLVVVGAIDGTLTFFKLDATKSTLVMHSSNNIHKGCINEIRSEQSQHTYVASSDGVVTAWDPSQEGPVLVQTIEFPEEILFVCDAPSKHILAASSHKLFIADMETGKIIITERVNESITGLFGNHQRVYVATTHRIYYIPSVASNDCDITKGVITSGYKFTPDETTLTPNFWMTPDLSLISVVFPHEVKILDCAFSTFRRYSNPNSAKFDSKFGALKINPVRYWFTVSMGTNIVTYVMEPEDDNAIISSVSPRISRSEIDARNFPTCHSLWWDIKGEVLFGLFSNNTLCWWYLPNITKWRIELDAKEKLEEQQLKQKEEGQQTQGNNSSPTDNS